VTNQVGGEDLALNTDYQLNGQTVSFTSVKYFLSGLEISDADGNAIALSGDGNSTVLVTSEGGSTLLGSTTANSFSTFDFAFGIDSLRNHADPMLADAPLDLSGDAEGMHWAWTSGYKFMRFEGLVDVSGTMTPFQYHVGFDDYYTSVPATQLDQDVNGDVTINVTLDIENMLFALSTDIEAGMFHGPTHPVEDAIFETMAAGIAFNVE